MKSIKIDAEICQVCGKYTEWYASFGPENFIICPRCMSIAKRKLNVSDGAIISMLCTFGEIRKESER